MIKKFNLNDEITIYSSSNLSVDEIQVLTLLYGPLIKPEAAYIYQTFSSLLSRSSLEAKYTYESLLAQISVKDEDFASCRIRLEAIGLIDTYKANNGYIMQLKAPMAAKEFFTDGILGMYLYSTVGDQEFRRLQNLFQLPQYKKENLEEVTATFDEVFESVADVNVSDDKFLLGKRLNKGVKINNVNFDFNIFSSGISLSFLEQNRVTKKFQTFILNISYAYMFSEQEMIELFNKSLNNSGFFDYMKATKVAREMYKEKTGKQVPELQIKDEVTQSETEELFNTISAATLIETTTGCKIASDLDISKVLDLYNEYESLPKSVIHVCVCYAVKKCSGKFPVKKYFKTILDDWIVKGIVTFKDAEKYVTETEKRTPGKKQPSWLEEYEKNFESRVEDL